MCVCFFSFGFNFNGDSIIYFILLCRSVAPSHLSCVLWDGGCRNSDFFFLSSLMTSWFELNRQLKSYLCSWEFVSVILTWSNQCAPKLAKKAEKRVFSFCVSLEFMLP